MIQPFNPIIVPPVILPETKIADGVMRAGNDLLARCVTAYTTQYNAVWNTTSVSPVAIVAAMGTQAAQVFARSAALAAFLVSQGAVVPTGVPAGFTVTINADGSATAAPAAAKA